MTHSVPVALSLLDPHSLLASAGALAVFLVLFAETGLLIGFFLPGDSLLFTAGLLCAGTNHSAVRLSLPAVLIAAAAGALAGAQCGYLIGRGAGQALLDRPGRPRLKAGVARARAVIYRYGLRRAVILARFIPVVRTVINPVAGAVGTPAGLFTAWQIVSGLIWTAGLTLAGYGLGSRISGIDRYLLPVIAVIVAVSLIPVAVELWRHRRVAGSGGPRADAGTGTGTGTGEPQAGSGASGSQADAGASGSRAGSGTGEPQAGAGASVSQAGPGAVGSQAGAGAGGSQASTGAGGSQAGGGAADRPGAGHAGR